MVWRRGERGEESVGVDIGDTSELGWCGIRRRRELQRGTEARPDNPGRPGVRRDKQQGRGPGGLSTQIPGEGRLGSVPIGLPAAGSASASAETFEGRRKSASEVRDGGQLILSCPARPLPQHWGCLIAGDSVARRRGRVKRQTRKKYKI